MTYIRGTYPSVWSKRLKSCKTCGHCPTTRNYSPRIHWSKTVFHRYRRSLACLCKSLFRAQPVGPCKHDSLLTNFCGQTFPKVSLITNFKEHLRDEIGVAVSERLWRHDSCKTSARSSAQLRCSLSRSFWEYLKAATLTSCTRVEYGTGHKSCIQMRDFKTLTWYGEVLQIFYKLCTDALQSETYQQTLPKCPKPLLSMLPRTTPLELFLNYDCDVDEKNIFDAWAAQTMH